ncbi:acyl-CoA thioesterase [Sphingomonas bacterium]|uniref:acyl-CoA thioesterase n=1 Tax=Sphingomonas bacterium TaxID=1895847 RepID=UPI0015763F91|nr:acyl-CoA thioesterase II [Sphingomonas bacterium]
MTDDATPRHLRSPEQLTAMLVGLLDVEAIDTDLYLGARLPGGRGRVFGGQVIGQALQAAQRSTDGKAAHSLHAYFMRPGDDERPIVFRVVRDFEGKSFATRRVIAMQGGQPILNMAASFQMPEDGLSHQAATMPQVPPPGALASDRDLRLAAIDSVAERWRRAFREWSSPIDLRPVEPRDWVRPVPGEPRQATWFRIGTPIDDDPALHRAVLAYASDLALMGTAMLPHGVGWLSHAMQNASLDHAIWLHEPFRADEWLLYACDSPWAGHARGFNRGQIFTAEGRLVASVAQEGLMRMRE